MLQTLEEKLNEAVNKDYIVGKVDSYYEDKWTKETGTVRNVVKGIKASKAYGFKVGKHYFMINVNDKSTIKNTTVYKATCEDNDHLIVYVDDNGVIYSDDASAVPQLKKTLK